MDYHGRGKTYCTRLLSFKDVHKLSPLFLSGGNVFKSNLAAFFTALKLFENKVILGFIVRKSNKTEEIVMTSY